MVKDTVRSLKWIGVMGLIRLRFWRVRPLSIHTLQGWLQQDNSPLLLDARKAEEFDVSHLPGAQWVSPAAIAALHSGMPGSGRSPLSLPGSEPGSGSRSGMDTLLPLDQPIVVYCSVGYRSARLAQQLQAVGYRSVWNLEGSLFAWVNAGYSVHQGDRPVPQVHPYNASWSALLHPSVVQADLSNLSQPAANLTEDLATDAADETPD
ncbi:MAG: rhodanese-like domain-containing protein [Kaiparowitsia implicata GSE-PSE-MK54-09C]|jgi:rhodanese-related sulfurtransferase|nr:rhodanese-like domain-containing protein [Kaiparowitsia implicata GSE-PSE-MK54-09C]